MTKFIENRVIYGHLSGANATSFDFTIQNIPFEPDYMVIRGFSFFPSANYNGVILVRCNLTNKYFPFMSLDGSFGETTQMDLHFPLNKLIDGTYTFDFLAYNAGTTSWTSVAPGAGNTWDFAINIEFVKI
jgi:hypothetical protein